MPVGRTGGRMRSRKVMILVTSAAFNRIQSLPIGSASYLHRVLMAVVPLTREVSPGVAIHATRMAQHRNDGLKSSRAILRRCGGKIGSRERKQECGYHVSGVSHIHALRSAAVTRSEVNGKSRRRAPVASKIALPIAAGVTVIAVSPAPIADTPGGVTKTHSMAGIS